MKCRAKNRKGEPCKGGGAHVWTGGLCTKHKAGGKCDATATVPPLTEDELRRLAEG